MISRYKGQLAGADAENVRESPLMGHRSKNEPKASVSIRSDSYGHIIRLGIIRFGEGTILDFARRFDANSR